MKALNRSTLLTAALSLTVLSQQANAAWTPAPIQGCHATRSAAPVPEVPPGVAVRCTVKFEAGSRLGETVVEASLSDIRALTRCIDSAVSGRYTITSGGRNFATGQSGSFAEAESKRGNSNYRFVLHVSGKPHEFNCVKK